MLSKENVPKKYLANHTKYFIKSNKFSLYKACLRHSNFLKLRNLRTCLCIIENTFKIGIYPSAQCIESRLDPLIPYLVFYLVNGKVL